MAATSAKKRFNVAIRSTLSSDSILLFDAAKFTIDSYVESGMVIGLGSGLASDFAIQYLGRQLRSGALKDIVGVPTSVGSASEAAKAGVPLDQYKDSCQIDLAFDDADAIETDTLAAIIGCQKMQGGESIIEEKAILKAAGKLVLFVTGKNYKCGIEGTIPVLIKSLNWLETAEEIDDLFIGDAEVWRRSSIGLVDPLGADVADSLDQVEGVVEHCIIARIPCTAVIASENGLRIVDNILETEGSSRV